MRLLWFSLAAGAFAAGVGTIVTACAAVPIAALIAGAHVLIALLGAVLLAPIVMILSIDALWQILPIAAPLAAVVGGTAQALGRRRPWLRRRHLWAAAGALIGASLYAAMKQGLMRDAASMLDMLRPGPWQLAPLALGGAAAALAFRAATHILATFFPPPEVDEAD